MRLIATRRSPLTVMRVVIFSSQPGVTHVYARRAGSA
jgi:hypothetical protein